MESRGQVNMYVEYRDSPTTKKILASLRKENPVQRRFFTVNLAHGTTPFIMHFNGVECASMNYRFITGIEYANISVAYYRPTAEAFAKLEPFIKEHVLRGGLMPLAFEKALAAQLENDPIEPSMNFNQVQIAMQLIYGERLPGEIPKPTPLG